MPKYLVERSFPEGFPISADSAGEAMCREIVEVNADQGVTWVHSYVTDDHTRSFCVYDAPSPEAIRKSAARNALPIDRITQVRVMSPYFHH